MAKKRTKQQPPFFSSWAVQKQVARWNWLGDYSNLPVKIPSFSLVLQNHEIYGKKMKMALPEIISCILTTKCHPALHIGSISLVIIFCPFH